MTRKKWSQDVTEHRDALDLEKDVFNRTFIDRGRDQRKPEHASDAEICQLLAFGRLR